MVSVQRTILSDDRVGLGWAAEMEGGVLARGLGELGTGECETGTKWRAALSLRGVQRVEGAYHLTGQGTFPASPTAGVTFPSLRMEPISRVGGCTMDGHA